MRTREKDAGKDFAERGNERFDPAPGVKEFVAVLERDVMKRDRFEGIVERSWD